MNAMIMAVETMHSVVTVMAEAGARMTRVVALITAIVAATYLGIVEITAPIILAE